MSQNQDSQLNVTRRTRSGQVEARVRAVLLRMAAEGTTPSFYLVAKEARVARSTLYRRPELRRLVEEARSVAQQTLANPTDQSDLLRENARLRAALEKIQRECAVLREGPWSVAEEAVRPWLVYGVCLLEKVA